MTAYLTVFKMWIAGTKASGSRTQMSNSVNR